MIFDQKIQCILCYELDFVYFCKYAYSQILKIFTFICKDIKYEYLNLNCKKSTSFWHDMVGNLADGKEYGHNNQK